jgi:hypothetical protein
MASERLPRLQRRILAWLWADAQRTRGTVTPEELDPVQRKAALVARLQALQAQGLTLQAIANRLNSEEVPTLSGRGGWKPGTVGNLLAEAKAAQP